MASVRSQVEDIANALLSMDAQVDNNIEDLIIHPGDPVKKQTVSKADLNKQAGKLFDLLSGGKKTLDPAEIAAFLNKNPDSAMILGFERDATSTSGFKSVHGFAKCLVNTAEHLPTRESFSAIISGQAYDVLESETRKTPNKSLTQPLSQTKLSADRAGYVMSVAYTKKHPEAESGVIDFTDVLKKGDKNKDAKYDIAELRAMFKEIDAHPTKYISPVDLNKPQAEPVKNQGASPQ